MFVVVVFSPVIKSETFTFSGFPGNPPAVQETCLIPGLGRSPGEGNSYPLQYPGWENSMDGIVHGVEKSLIRLSDFHFFSPFHLEHFMSLVDPNCGRHYSCALGLVK